MEPRCAAIALKIAAAALILGGGLPSITSAGIQVGRRRGSHKRIPPPQPLFLSRARRRPPSESLSNLQGGIQLTLPTRGILNLNEFKMNKRRFLVNKSRVRVRGYSYPISVRKIHWAGQCYKEAN